MKSKEYIDNCKQPVHLYHISRKSNKKIALSKAFKKHTICPNDVTVHQTVQSDCDSRTLGV